MKTYSTQIMSHAILVLSVIAGPNIVACSNSAEPTASQSDAVRHRANAPDVSLSPSTLAFGDESVGTKSATQFVTLTNPGLAPLSLPSALTMDGTDFAFADLGTCTTEVVPGGSCTISVLFAPTSPGARVGTVVIHDNAPGSPHFVPLAGVGISSAEPGDAGSEASAAALDSGATGNYYVSTIGDDSNPGTWARPFRHLSMAARVAMAGQTVVVMDGTYDNEGQVAPSYVVTLSNSGTSEQPITFIAQHRGQAILDSMNTVTDASPCNGASAYLNLYTASYIVIQGFVFQNACDEGIHSNDSASNITLRWNELRYIANRVINDEYGRDGMYANPSCHDFLIDGNVFHDIGRTNQVNLDHGLYLHGTNFTVVNNVFYNIPHGWSVQLADGLNNISIANNTFAFADDYQGGQIMLWNTQTNISIVNNIFFGSPNFAVNRYTSTVSGCEINHNLVAASGAVVISDPTGCTLDATNLTATDPLFVNDAVVPYDFHLRSGSPAIDTGATIAAVTDDIDGVSRPQGTAYDIGAYEYQTP